MWIHQKYKPSHQSRTVYYLNHTSWWDGLIPLLLNEYRFKQQGRAMMLHEQMKRYWFFKWLGAFSIKPNDHLHTLASLRYALQSMQRKHSGLFIYPQGEIAPTGSSIHFKPGLSWLSAQLPNVDFVPIGIHIHTVRHDKPELHLWVDEALKIEADSTGEEMTAFFKNKMETVLQKLHQTAGFDDAIYDSFF